MERDPAGGGSANAGRTVAVGRDIDVTPTIARGIIVFRSATSDADNT
jgi:hypothetical protein